MADALTLCHLLLAHLSGAWAATESAAEGLSTANPVAAVLQAAFGFVVAFLSFVSALVAFTTITVPKAVYAVLSYSLTLQLHFPALFGLTIVLLSVAFLVVRYRYLNRYSALREEPLEKDENFNLHPDVAASGDGPPSFHNYLDEFLQAIRIFGFLEKPVFHELARHLQTRRLIAGDSLSLDNDLSFYIVIDGHVQVFAPTDRPRDPNDPSLDVFEDDDEEGRGYQLLNEVENGGTLSSLFTILSLFTEDVRLRYEEDSTRRDVNRPSTNGTRSNTPGHHYRRSVGSTSCGRRGSSVQGRSPMVARLPHPTDFSLESHGSPQPALASRPRSETGSPNPLKGHDDVHALGDAGHTGTAHGRSSSGISDGSTVQGDPLYSAEIGSEQDADTIRADSDASASPGVTPNDAVAPGRAGSSTIAPASSADHHNPAMAPSDILKFPSSGTYDRQMSTPPSGPTSPWEYESARFRSRAPSNSRLSTASVFSGGDRSKPSGYARAGVPGTVARATVDTTLAVIPAEAFRRLTKKFPNAAAHIVQVILTRLARVTFHTAHKYLGLTKEVIRTEKAINELACYPLPSVFYEKGGMERLRQRFLPEPASSRNTGSDETDTGGDSDYFTSPPREASRTKSGASDWSRSPPKTPSGHLRKSTKTPTGRRHVGPGDLLSMTGTTEGFRQSYIPQGLPTPKIGRGMPPTHAVRSTEPTATGTSSPVSGELDDRKQLGEDFDLRDAVMDSLAKSIGLTQPPLSQPPSAEASPWIPANDHALQRTAVSNSAFSSLTLLEAAMGEDENSSSITASSLTGGSTHELENEVEILFFPRGSALVKAGERNAGLFFVIDGFLEVLVPPETPGGEEPNIKPAGGAKGRQDKVRSPALGSSEKVPRSQPSGAHAHHPKLTTTARSGASRRSSDQPRRGSASPTSPVSPTAARRTNSQSLPGDSNAPTSLFTVKAGGIAGYLASLCGMASYVDIRAKTDAYVGFLPAHALEKIMEKRPIVLLTLCKRLISLLSPLLLHIDSALDWQQVNAGQVIHREGDEADSFYIVINGRLRSITEKAGGGVEVLNEYGQGDSVGELEVITNSKRPSTLHAIRDSELARMPMTLFNAISIRHPAITIQISRIIARRVSKELEKKSKRFASQAIPGAPDIGRNNFNLKTIAILPVTRHIPVTEFATRLRNSFEDIGAPTAFLNQARVMSVLGRHAFSRMGKLKLAGWLADQEQKYRIVLYVVDTAVSSAWTQTSIRQADCILLLGLGDDPSVGEYERLLTGIKTTARKELVLLHPERSVHAGSTRQWLKERPWIHAHHHVEMPGVVRTRPLPVFVEPAPVQAFKNLKQKVQSGIQRYRGVNIDDAYPRRAHHLSDFARLARRLCGKSIGLVLGGGGARGCAHLGVIRALEERGMPIDMIGGTSIGSFVGGLYASEADLVSTIGRTKKFAGRIGSLWRILSDLTYPVVSYTTGHEFNRGIFKAFRDSHIEDMWLPYFCNTTNLTWSRMDVHTTGYAWRYVRASMTLAGFLPPLVDDGNMLADGGYVDNLPVSVMLAMGASTVFAVDVGSIDDTSPQTFGDSLSGWWVLLNRYNPWSDARNIPSIPDIQSRLAYVSSVRTLEEAKSTPECLYLRMPVESFGTLEFKKFGEIQAVGYDAARRMLDEFEAEGRLPSGTDTGKEAGMETSRRRGRSARRNSI